MMLAVAERHHLVDCSRKKEKCSLARETIFLTFFQNSDIFLP